jgi:hypothetical protein
MHDQSVVCPKVSNNMTESTIRPDQPADMEAANLQPGPLGLQSGPGQALAVLTPCAAEALTNSENAAEFSSLVKAVAEYWQPQDVIERMLMVDFIHAEWELGRLRRMVPLAFRAGQPFAVAKLEGLDHNFSESSFPSRTYSQTLADLAARGQTEDVLDAQTLLMHASAFESFDKRMAVLEVRRDGALEKVERRRSARKAISSQS